MAQFFSYVNIFTQSCLYFLMRCSYEAAEKTTLQPVDSNYDSYVKGMDYELEATLTFGSK